MLPPSLVAEHGNNANTRSHCTMRNKKLIAAAVAVGLIAAVPAANASGVTGIISGADVKNGTIMKRDLSAGIQANLKKRAKDGADGATGPQGIQGLVGPQGPKGDKGAQGVPGFAGAFYATALYNQGNTNAGAIATVACNADPAKTDYVAISGGVQVLGLDATANSRNTPVSSSFPGRMNWDTNSPRDNRLDGWIVQFGGNAGATSDKAPEKVKVWALCVPNMPVSVVETFKQVG
jgi:Collagen triple helix repeat (20 copies)